MRTPSWTHVLSLSIIAVLVLAAPVAAGKIVINNDEWTLSNTGFATNSVNDPGQFATNVAAWFTGGAPGSLRAWSSSFGLTESALSAAITGAGYTWTVSTAGTFDLAALQTYDAVFLAGAAPAAGDYTDVLIAYVEGGGNVYLAGGSGVGGATVEAARWNPFLNHFGLAFVSSYNGIKSNLPISSPHPIFAGVDHLYQDNGNSILDLAPADPRNQILISQDLDGLYAVFESSPAVPEPATSLLFMLGMGALTLTRTRRRTDLLRLHRHR